MTTDTLPKGFSRQCSLAGARVSISGISKGSGMIHPNMATMLGFIATDAAIAQPVLEHLNKCLSDASFNRISVDGDTSTNDACMLVATGALNMPPIESCDDPRYAPLYEALLETYQFLAHAIVRDGEGATKFVTLEVEQAGSADEALQVAKTVAHSPLVKTALFASDANWGRIAAVGRAGLADLVGGHYLPRRSASFALTVVPTTQKRQMRRCLPKRNSAFASNWGGAMLAMFCGPRIFLRLCAHQCRYRS